LSEKVAFGWVLLNYLSSSTTLNNCPTRRDCIQFITYL